MTSSDMADTTNRSSSSISEVLDFCEVDAETILGNLGFKEELTQTTPWIPPRFFSVPSHAEGIDFQLFLRAQIQRIEMEDPCLMLVSRFRHVQALAATTDAFFCLYSYITNTSMQKTSPGHSLWAFPEIPDFWNVPSQPESFLHSLQKATCWETSFEEEGPLGLFSLQSPKYSLEREVWGGMEKTQKARVQFNTEDVKDETQAVSNRNSFCPNGMGGGVASSVFTDKVTVPVIHPCCFCEAPSYLQENTEPSLPKLTGWFSFFSHGTSMERLDNLGYQELCHYGYHFRAVATSPDESSEESDGE